MADKKDSKKFDDAVKKLKSSWDDVAGELASGKRFSAEVGGTMGYNVNGNDKVLKLSDFKTASIEKKLKLVEAAIKTLEATAK